MTTTDDRPTTCPSWCTDCHPDEGDRAHFSPIVSLPGDDPEGVPTMDGLARVWALAQNAAEPTYFVHVSRECTPAEVRATAEALLSFVVSTEPTNDHLTDPRWAAVAEHERYVEANAPVIIPPCPSWCRLPEGHDYPSVAGFGPDLTFERQHVAFEGKVTEVAATEHNHRGTVTVDEPEVYLNVRSEAYSVDVVRAVAAELAEAADVLERLTP